MVNLEMGAAKSALPARKVGHKNKKPRLIWRGRKTTNYNPMNIFKLRACGRKTPDLQAKRQLNGSQSEIVAEIVFLTTCLIKKFGKSSQTFREDLLSHLNLYNPMNISHEREFF